MRAAFASLLLLAACQGEPAQAPEASSAAPQSEAAPTFDFETQGPRPNTETVAVAAGPDADRLAQHECRGGAVQEWGRSTDGDTVVYRCTGEAY